MIELRQHQKVAVEKARKQANLALFFDAGTGKTGTMVRILAEEFNRAKNIVNTLIFAPISVCSQWPGEFEKFSKIPPELIHVMVGAGKKRTEALSGIIASKKPAIVVTNYEAVQIDAFYELLLAWCPEILVLDESHRIKDSQAKRSKAIYPLAHGARRRFLLTGTPVVNSLLDIFGQYKALDPSIFGPGFWSFRTKFFFDRNAGRKFAYPDWIPHPWASEQIGKAIADSSVQAKRDECLDLPPLQQLPVPVQLSPQQAKAYEEMKKDFLTEVNGLVASSEFEMVKTLRMQQILSGFVQPDESKEPVFFKDQPRLDALMDLIDGIGKEQFIVWTTFKPTYRRIGAELEKAKITFGFLTGEQSVREKQDAIAAFKRGELQGLIANPAAASEGINLQEARYAFYYMRGYNLLHFLQSLARNYRSGTERLHKSVVHYHLYARGTLDEVIAHALLHKEDVCKAVLRWAKEGFTHSLDKCKV